MRIFLTGAPGFIGSHIIPQLLNAGHQVLGLTRSEEGAQKILAAGAEVHRGNLEDLASIRSGAEQTDGVIHCGFNHDFSKFMANVAQDKLVIETVGDVLAGSERPLLITSGVGMGTRIPGQPATEDYLDVNNPNPRTGSELAGVKVSERGVNVSVVRLPQVHDTTKQGIITYMVSVAREKGVSAYVGEGLNRLSAAHVSDVARLYYLAFEKAASSSRTPGIRYNAVSEEGVPVREIAEVIGRGLGVPSKSITPEESAAHFGWLGMFAGMDLVASSALTRERLNWHPTGPGLIADLEAMQY